MRTDNQADIHTRSSQYIAPVIMGQLSFEFHTRNRWYRTR